MHQGDLFNDMWQLDLKSWEWYVQYRVQYRTESTVQPTSLVACRVHCGWCAFGCERACVCLMQQCDDDDADDPNVLLRVLLPLPLLLSSSSSVSLSLSCTQGRANRRIGMAAGRCRLSSTPR